SKMGLAHPPLSPVGLELWRWIECSAPLFCDATFWDCLAHLSVERSPGRRLVAPCGMALVMRYSRICERSSRSSRRLIASHRCTRVSEFAGKRHLHSPTGRVTNILCVLA